MKLIKTSKNKQETESPKERRNKTELKTNWVNTMNQENQNETQETSKKQHYEHKDEHRQTDKEQRETHRYTDTHRKPIPRTRRSWSRRQKERNRDWFTTRMWWGTLG